MKNAKFPTKDEYSTIIHLGHGDDIILTEIFIIFLFKLRRRFVNAVMASKVAVQQFINNLKNVKTYDKLCQHVTVVSAGNGSIKATMPVMEEHLNGRGTLHGGCTASLIDSVSSYGFATADDGKPGVSVDMSIQYIGAAKLGDIITIESTALKQKGLVRFADVLVTDQDGKIIAKASHTKAMK